MTSHVTECSLGGEGTSREPIQAFVCKNCGAKIIGKDFYFTHLQSDCKLNQQTSSKQSCEEEEIYKTAVSKTTLTSCSTSPMESKNLKTSKPKISEPLQQYLGEAIKDEHIESQLNNQELATDHLNCEDSGNLESLISKENESSIYFSEKKKSGLESSPQTYIHKKFDHDQDRTNCLNAKAPSEVQRYIQNFQSLLVNKLNQTFEPISSVNPIVKFSAQNKPVGEGKAVLETEKQSLSTSSIQETLPSRNIRKLDEKQPSTRVKYECRICLKTFLNKKTKEVHQRLHCHRKPYVCSHCHKSFSKSILLRRHKREVHSNVTFYCNLCGRHFSSARTLDNHKGIHEKKQFRCKQCTYMCHTASGLRTHTFEVHSARNEKLSCPHCGEKFKRNYGLKRHIDRKHKNENLVCRYCDKKFRCKEDLTLHLNTHLKFKSLTCNVCNQFFTTPGSLKRHSAKHKQNADTFKCDTCSSVFTRKDSLLSHIKLHASPSHFLCKCGIDKESRHHVCKQQQASQFYCYVCQKTFRFEITLKNHNCKGKAKVS